MILWTMFPVKMPGMLLIVLLLGAGRVVAQEAPPAPGDRLRVHAPSMFGARPRVAGLDGVAGDTLLLRGRYGERTRVPFAAVGRIERSRGSHRVAAALLGAAAGLLVSTAWVAASDPGSWACDGEFCGLARAAPLVAVSALAGAGLGHRLHRERWIEIPLPAITTTSR